MTSATTQTLWAIAARRLAMPPEKYAMHRLRKEQWCYRCRKWHPEDGFPRDRSRPSGRSGTCRACRAVMDEERRR